MISGLIRLGYRGAYWCARAWWFIRRPTTQGAAVAIWCRGRVLLVKTSYRDRYTLPGGFVGRHERGPEAACREIREEVGVTVTEDHLTLAYDESLFVEHHHDRLLIFEIELPSEPVIQANGRELVWVGWKTGEEAASLPLLLHVRAYLAGRSDQPTP